MIAMEACLVRIMKARKKAAHTDLVDEAVSHMSRLFKVRWRKRERESVCVCVCVCVCV